MKKAAYIQPLTTIVSIASQVHLMAGSNEFSEDSIDLNIGTMGSGDGSDASSRGFDLWDDEY